MVGSLEAKEVAKVNIKVLVDIMAQTRITRRVHVARSLVATLEAKEVAKVDVTVTIVVEEVTRRLRTARTTDTTTTFIRTPVPVRILAVTAIDVAPIRNAVVITIGTLRRRAVWIGAISDVAPVDRAIVVAIIAPRCTVAVSQITIVGDQVGVAIVADQLTLVRCIVRVAVQRLATTLLVILATLGTAIQVALVGDTITVAVDIDRQ